MGLFGLPEIAGCQLHRHSMAVAPMADRPILLRILGGGEGETVQNLWSPPSPSPPPGSPEPDLVPGQNEVEETLKQEEDVEAPKDGQQAPSRLCTDAHLLMGMAFPTVCVQSQHLRRKGAGC